MTPYFEQGGITIYHGDCREVLPTLDVVDHVLTDPPYARDVYQRLGMPKTHAGSETPSRLKGTLYRSTDDREAGRMQEGKNALGIRSHQYSSMSIEKLAAGAIGFVDELRAEVAAEIARLTRRWALVFSDIESCHVWRADLETAGMRYIRTGAWVKDGPMPQFSGDRPAVGMEVATITHAKGPMRWNGGGKPAIWRYGTVKADRPNHPCPKPLNLMRDLVAQFTDAGETVLDPFLGAGTTARACMDLGRRCIGTEVEEKYCEVAAKRLEQQVLDFGAVS